MKVLKDVSKFHHLVGGEFPTSTPRDGLCHAVDREREVTGMRLSHLAKICQEVLHFHPMQIVGDGVSKKSLECVVLTVIQLDSHGSLLELLPLST
jgi:hypothetical protein